MHHQSERSISVLASEESVNVSRHLALLGDDGYQLVTMVEALYDALPSMCRFPLDVVTNDDAHAAGINAHLMMICRRQLTVGILTLMRGYRVDALAHLRKAVELCAFTVKMAKHPHMSRTWLVAGNSDAAWDKFRDKFTKLWPDDDPQVKSLEYTFDEASKAMHSSVYSVAHYLSEKRRVDGFPDIGVFDLTSDATFYAYFIRFIDCHLTILALFQRTLKKYTGDTGASLLRLEGAKVAFSVKHREWMPVVATAIHNVRT